MKKFTRWNAMVCESELCFEEDVKIGAYCFRGKWAIHKIKMKGESYIGKGAFSRARNIKSLQLGKLCTLGKGAFAHARFPSRSVDYDSLDSIQGIHKRAFQGCRKYFFTHYEDGVYFGNESNPYDLLVRADAHSTEIRLHPKTKFILHGALSKCKALSRMELPEGLVEIGCSVFYKKLPLSEYQNALYFGSKENPYSILVRAKDARITECVVHRNTEFIVQDAFDRCNRLERVVFENGRTRMSECVFEKCKSITTYVGPVLPLVKMPKKRLSSVNIIEGECLPKHALLGARSLKNLSLFPELKRIEDEALYGCSALSRVVIPISVEKIGKRAFFGCSSLLIISDAKERGDQWDESFSLGARAVRWGGEGSAGVKYFFDPVNNCAYIQSCKADELEDGTVLVTPQRHGYPVVSVLRRAFAYNERVERVELLCAAMEFELDAFLECKTLQSVSVEGDVPRIAPLAFCGCSSLAEFHVGGRVGIIEGYAFKGCTSLQNIGDAFDEVSAVGRYAFLNCTGLKKAIFAKGTSVIAEGTFEGCTALERVVIPEGIEKIEKGAFRGCSGLREIQLPRSLKTIEREAFADCTSLQSIRFPNNVTMVGSAAFKGCTALKKITMDEFPRRIEPETFMGCTALERLSMPNWIHIIGERAFAGCTALTQLILPVTIEELEDECFMGCTSLKRVDLPERVAKIGKCVFKDCKALCEFSLPGTVTRLGEGMFMGCGFEKLELAAHISTIGTKAFAECYELSELRIPDTVKQIEPYAFNKCGNLMTLTIGDGVEVVGEHAFAMCGSMHTLTLGANVCELKESAFGWCGKLSDIHFGERLTKIGDGAFSCCHSLLALYLPEGVVKIGKQAFFRSQNLKKVYIPGSVEYIGAEAFCGCHKDLSVQCHRSEEHKGWDNGWIAKESEVSFHAD